MPWGLRFYFVLSFAAVAYALDHVAPSLPFAGGLAVVVAVLGFWLWSYVDIEARVLGTAPPAERVVRLRDPARPWALRPEGMAGVFLAAFLVPVASLAVVVPAMRQAVAARSGSAIGLYACAGLVALAAPILWLLITVVTP